jgi:hypothetical protein
MTNRRRSVITGAPQKSAVNSRLHRATNVGQKTALKVKDVLRGKQPSEKLNFGE